MITLGPSLTGLRGTQVMGSIIYTLVTIRRSLYKAASSINKEGATCGTRTEDYIGVK
jgi:hypothetical protein